MRMEQGATFDELLQSAVMFYPETADSLAPTALEEYGFGALLAETSPDAAGSQVRSVQEFYALAPARLIVELRVPIEEGRPEMDIHFSGDFSQLASDQFVIPNPELFTVQVPRASLTVRGQPVLQDASDLSEALLRVIIAVPSVPRIDDQRLSQDSDHQLPKLRLDADGVHLTLDEPVRVRVSGDEMVIRQGDPEGAEQR